MGAHLRVLSESVPINTIMTYLVSGGLDESSFSIRRVNIVEMRYTCTLDKSDGNHICNN